jgi:glutathione peroxidase
MMRKNILLTALIFLTMATMNAQTTFHDFTVKDINGNEYPLAQLKGKKVLVVNTASKCGLTPQYDALQALYEKYGGNDFIIIGFPANNFMKQEPGSDEEIAEFCSVNYGVTFPMMSKISVKGKDQHAVYKWLTSKDENGKEDSKVSWNFQKYMINEDGQLVGHFSPRTRPDHEDIVAWITK